MSDIKKGSCHCGAVEFEVELNNGFESIRRCNCSLCRRKGSIIASVPVEKLTITKGSENLTLYQWNTKTAKHYFCKICGIYTHHQRRSNPKEFGFNVACIEGVNPFDFKDIAIGDGASQSLTKIDKINEDSNVEHEQESDGFQVNIRKRGVSDEDLLKDMKSVANKLSQNSLARKE